MMAITAISIYLLGVRMHYFFARKKMIAEGTDGDYTLATQVFAALFWPVLTVGYYLFPKEG